MSEESDQLGFTQSINNTIAAKKLDNKLHNQDPTNPRADQAKKGEVVQDQNSCGKDTMTRRCHRVTFKDENEVASEDINGTLRVIYRKLGETIRDEEEEEWDNPFQPDGEVSQDADLILQLWKDGIEITEETFRSIVDEENEPIPNITDKEGQEDLCSGHVGDNCVNEEVDCSRFTETLSSSSSSSLKSKKDINAPANKKLKQFAKIIFNKNWLLIIQLLQKRVLSVKGKEV